jgi:hypothetical protein
MTSRRVLAAVAVAVGLAYPSGPPVARADPTPAPAAEAKRKPAAAPVKAKPAPKPAHTAKKPPKQAAAPETSASTESTKPRPGAAGHDIVEHESRIEFDERMVRGQTAAGAIFLFQRTPSDLKSIVEVPSSFRERTVELLQPLRGTP